MFLISTDTLKTVFDYLDENTLLIFDIDHTLFEPAQTFGSFRWQQELKKKLILQGITEKEAHNEACSRWKEIQHLTPIKPVEKSQETLLERLQKINISILGLTARNNYLAQLTKKQLSSLYLNDFFSLPYEDCEVKMPAPASFINGVLYCGKNSKGKALRAFIGQIKLSPKKIVFVDDQLDYLHQVEEEFSSLGIELIGIHYTASIISCYDHKVVKIQESYYPRIISDEHAQQLINGV